MGEVGQYHITMLVNSEQEDSIRKLFTDKNWTCWLNGILVITVIIQFCLLIKQTSVSVFK
jgi:hypothetical protein